MRNNCFLNCSKQKFTRQELRKNSTEDEDKLWAVLRGKQLGVKFARQDGIENYIVDFCCRRQRLVIEVDGGIHDDKEVKENDLKRTKELENYGYCVIRFKNEQILKNLDEVISIIKNHLK